MMLEVEAIAIGFMATFPSLIGPLLSPSLTIITIIRPPSRGLQPLHALYSAPFSPLPQGPTLTASPRETLIREKSFDLFDGLPRQPRHVRQAIRRQGAEPRRPMGQGLVGSGSGLSVFVLIL